MRNPAFRLCLCLSLWAAASLTGCDRPPPLGGGLRPDGGGPKAMSLGDGAAASLAAQDFLTKAVGADLYQIEAAKVAALKAHSAEIKAFAKAMGEEHASSRALLVAAAKGPGQPVPVPTQPTEQQQSMLHLLNREKPSDFDRTFIEQQVQIHQETLAVIDAYARGGQIASIRAVANGLAPDLRQDLDKAQAIEDAMDKS